MTLNLVNFLICELVIRVKYKKNWSQTGETFSTDSFLFYLKILSWGSEFKYCTVLITYFIF